MSHEAHSILNHLASGPVNHSTARRKIVREIMEQTGGQLMVRGHLREIVSKHLGAGVYRLSTKEWKHA